MPMNLKLSESHAIFNFVEFQPCYEPLKIYADNFFKKAADGCTSDWTLILQFACKQSDCIAIYKHGISYPIEKEKVVTIIIPIPSSQETSYGIKKNRFAMRPPIDKKKFWTLEVDFGKYETLYDLMLNFSKAGIKTLFEKGISIGGDKLKKVEQLDGGI